ncbi:thermostable hemolysin [Massilia yuzhufengensis]|uniref:Thermostable hemolysin n=1 Tax=Massilia yuzhufengensis TaxID=1164594 RepID=A0A1I1R4X3_9BURK|nr:thermostable hemolysin [Massilia yuzhufengensis]SFD27198.1 Thermostable hemolysin [Massilia yuzhufengensis]
MTQMPTCGALAPAPARTRGRASHTARSFEFVGPGDAARPGLETFIADAFQASYGARVSHFCDMLVGTRSADGGWTAALGYSLAAAGPTFLEQYLDGPLDAEIGARLGRPVTRDQVVEVGNLAASSPGEARALIVHATGLLYELGLHIVAFTATASLLNSFGRLRLHPQLLAPADPLRLPGGGCEWGSYYDTHPHVMFGDIRYGYEKLARLASREASPAV